MFLSSRKMKLGLCLLFLSMPVAFAGPSSKKPNPAPTAHLNTEPKPVPPSRASGVEVGLLLGMNMASEGASSASAIGFGFNLGVNVLPTLTVGGTFFTSGLTPGDFATSRNTNLFLFLGNLEYHFLKISEGLYANVKFGQAMRDTTYGSPQPGASRTFNFASGMGVGYSYSVYNELSIGGELNYVAVFAPLVTHNILGLLTVKYLFAF
jgi:hypothetical protein